MLTCKYHTFHTENWTDFFFSLLCVGSLVFSQSLLALDMMEAMLAHLDDKAMEERGQWGTGPGQSGK